MVALSVFQDKTQAKIVSIESGPQANEPPPSPAAGLNFLLRPTTPISPSLTRAGRSFPELSRLTSDIASIDVGGGGGVEVSRATDDDEEEEENADIDDEMRGFVLPFLQI